MCLSERVNVLVRNTHDNLEILFLVINSQWVILKVSARFVHMKHIETFPNVYFLCHFNR